MFGQVNWAGPMPGSHPAWYLTHEYVGRDHERYSVLVGATASVMSHDGRASGAECKHDR